ncbi:hypothetical protein VKT23_019719 [Stygiomarasmius scandens]|uniref:Uncharacterized protein n=1 Tax=Marasmiellus scandens TaxID=2682957 RepID=A0ABR1IKR1_9AGAR
MRFIPTATIASAFFFATSGALAQFARIGFPTEGASVPAGSTLSVDVVRPLFDAQGNVIVSSEVGIVLGITSCPTNPQDCIDPAKTLGTMLYNGDFYPVFGDGAEPNVNITIQIPDDTPKGAAQLNLGHFFLLGAEFSPQVESSSVKITIV